MMVLSSTAVSVLLEAAEAAGIPRSRLLDASTLDPFQVEWSQYVAIVERLSHLVDGDRARLRDIGGNVARVPAHVFVQRLAADIVTPRMLYIAGQRWFHPAVYPHLPLVVDIVGAQRVRCELAIPEPYAPSTPLFHLFEGVFRELPCLLGLSRATIVSSELTPRRLSVLLDLPSAPPLLARMRRSIRSRFGGRQRVDLLERQRTELEKSIEEMRRLSEEFQRLLDDLPDPVAILRNGAFLWVNRTMLKTLGYEQASDLVGFSATKFVHESSLALATENLLLPIGGRIHPIEVRFKRRDGEIVLWEISPPQRIVFGGSEARLIVGRDVTERVRMQQRLVTANRLSSLALLSAGVAHEINNPLAYTLGSIENARRSLEGPAPDATQAIMALDTALEGIERVRSVVRDFGMLSRPDERSAQVIDVRKILDSTLTLAGKEIEGRARVVRDYAPVPEVRMNVARLGQVFLNLMVNAVEWMPEASEDNELRVRTFTDAGGEPVVEISDTGAGIPAELLDRVFDPFFTTKPDGQGTGLGLAICHRILTEAGGEISVVSTPGRGSTFRLVLPRAGEVAQ